MTLILNIVKQNTSVLYGALDNTIDRLRNEYIKYLKIFILSTMSPLQ